MKFSLFSILAILSVTATAATSGHHVPSTGHEVKRQQATRPPVGQPAMADANGNVVPYNRNGVVNAKVKREQMAQAKRHATAVKRRAEKNSRSRKRTTTASKPSKTTKRAATPADRSKGVKRAAGHKATKTKKRTVNRH